MNHLLIAPLTIQTQSVHHPDISTRVRPCPHSQKSLMMPHTVQWQSEINTYHLSCICKWHINKKNIQARGLSGAVTNHIVYTHIQSFQVCYEVGIRSWWLGVTWKSPFTVTKQHRFEQSRTQMLFSWLTVKYCFWILTVRSKILFRISLFKPVHSEMLVHWPKYILRAFSHLDRSDRQPLLMAWWLKLCLPLFLNGWLLKSKYLLLLHKTDTVLKRCDMCDVM